jgi:hypothetical protein
MAGHNGEELPAAARLAFVIIITQVTGNRR